MANRCGPQETWPQVGQEKPERKQDEPEGRKKARRRPQTRGLSTDTHPYLQAQRTHPPLLQNASCNSLPVADCQGLELAFASSFRGAESRGSMAATMSLPSLSLPNTLNYKAVARRHGAGVVSVRAANAEGPLRRPSAPGAPSIVTSPAPPSPPTSEPSPSPSPSQLSTPPPAPAKVAPPGKTSAVSIEYQRQRAKELQEYFLDKQYEEKVRGERIFGWTRKNEIANGR